MVGGQTLDICHAAEQNDDVMLEMLYQMHYLKTGRLIQVALEAGGLIADAPLPQQRALREYGKNVGLAFQIADDLLDAEGTAESLGKTTGDAEKGKLTFPAVLGIERSRALAQQTAAAAVEQLSIWGEEANALREFAWFVVNRKS
jgi:geranylgeranyl pyrophosphate synthase